MAADGSKPPEAGAPEVTIKLCQPTYEKGGAILSRLIGSPDPYGERERYTDIVRELLKELSE